mmetsp:Transcript_50972/g.168791  ORF Transcript_50972/g.168791 Transcript_50972/m.168791 type:complete len:306 (-) Transcript_50972:548-1465(-)
MLPAAIPGSGPGVAQANAAMDCIALWGLSDLAGLLNHPAHPPPGDLMDPSDTRQMLLDLDFTGLPDSSSEGTVEPNGFANASAESQSALQQLGIQHCLEQSPPTLRPRRDTPHDKEKNDFFDKTRQEVKAQADAFIRGRLSQHLPGHKLPLAKVKTIISKHSCDTPLYIGAGVPAGLAGMGEIFIRWLTKLSYQNAEREKRPTHAVALLAPLFPTQPLLWPPLALCKPRGGGWGSGKGASQHGRSLTHGSWLLPPWILVVGLLLHSGCGDAGDTRPLDTAPAENILTCGLALFIRPQSPPPQDVA